MAEAVEDMVLRIRTDTRGFVDEIAGLRAQMEGPLVEGAERAGQAIEGALLRAVRNGRVGFEDLRRVAQSAMGEIARAAIRAAIPGQGGGSLATLLARVVLGSPGRATGGPVAPDRPYLVGERGAEWFVPTSAGRIEPVAPQPAQRAIQITVHVGRDVAGDPQRMAASGKQVARAVRNAIMQVA